jgi:hypothetical protein
MAEKVTLTINVTPEERQRIEELAQQRGYAAPGDYLLALVESDAEEFDFETREGLVAGLRESFHQAVKGNTRPISELWDELEDE